MDIVFVLSHVPNPRMNKRISLIKAYKTMSLVCWNRETVNLWRMIHEDIECKEVRIKAAYKNPIHRMIPTCKFALEAIKYLRKMNPKCIYTENVDMLVVCSLYTFFKKVKPKIIYEIADLHTLVIDESNNIIKKLLKRVIVFLEKRLCRKVSLLVLTSEQFYDLYFKNFFPKGKVLFMPNMPTLYPFSSYRPKKSGVFTVGFIGGVRYKEQMKMLIRAAKNCKIKVLFAGGGFDDEIESLCKFIQNIEYYGKYDYDTEIASLYGKCDCVYSVYNADLNNVKVALPNKLYEAIYCGLPIIVAKNTYLAELVESLGVGVAVSHSDSGELKEVLKRMSEDEPYYRTFVDACYAHKEEINMDSYNKRLMDRIKTIV